MKKLTNYHRSNLSVCMILLPWLYIIEAITWYIKSNTIDNFFQAICVSIMSCFVLAKGHNNKGIRVQNFFFLYIILLIFALLPDLVYGEVMSGFRILIMYSIPLITYVYIYNYYQNKPYVDSALLTIPIFYGTLVSIHMILYEVGSLFGVPIEKTYEYIGKMDYMAVIASMFGIPMGNYAHFGSIAGREVVRAWGYAIEPSKLSVFLLIPIFISYGIYKQVGGRKYCVISIICFVCFVLTLSRAGYVSFLGTIVFKKILGAKKSSVRDSNKVTSNKDICKIVVFIPVFIFMALIALSIMVFLGQIFPELTFLYSGITDIQTGKATLVRDSSVDSGLIIDSFLQRPWGWGFSNTLHVSEKAMQDTNLSNAFILWLIAGGIGGAATSLLLLFILLKNYAIPCIKSNNHIKNAIGMTFIGFTIHSLSYGTWMTSDYLIVVSIMTVALNREIIWNTKRKLINKHQDAPEKSLSVERKTGSVH